MKKNPLKTPQFFQTKRVLKKFNVFKKGWGLAWDKENKSLSTEEMEILKKAAAKVALYHAKDSPNFYQPEAWFVYLSVMINQIAQAKALS